MKRRLLICSTFTMLILVSYQFIDINLFTIDFPRRVNSELFKTLRKTPEVDTQLFVLDIGYLDLEIVKTKIEQLESLQPKIIGVNLCNIDDKSEVLDTYLRENRKIVTCDCNPNSDKGTSRITNSANEVTQFKADKHTYFEMQLCNNLNGLKERANNTERINFRPANFYFQAPLESIDDIYPEAIKDKIVLIGFLRDSLITPLNEFYRRGQWVRGDMSDAQISANIISTIDRNEFINDIYTLLRVLIILFTSLLCTGLIILLHTRFHVVNIFLALIILIGLNSLSSYLIVLAFSNNYYLELNEMTVVLIVSATLGVYWNTKQVKESARLAEFAKAGDGVN